MLVKLCNLASWDRFPDGISLAHNQRIARLINQYGTMAKVNLEANTHEALEKALKAAESGDIQRLFRSSN